MIAPLLDKGMSLREIGRHSWAEIHAMVTALNRLRRFEHGKEIHALAESGREVSGKMADEYETCYWAEMDRFAALKKEMTGG